MNDNHHFQIHGADTPTLLGRLALMLNRNRVAVRMFEMHPRPEQRDLRVSFEILCGQEMAVRVARQLDQLVDVHEVNWSTRAHVTAA